MDDFVCDLCFRTFTKRYNLTNHTTSVPRQYLRRGKSESTEPQCPYCQLLFSREDNLVRHIKNNCSQKRKGNMLTKRDFQFHNSQIIMPRY